MCDYIPKDQLKVGTWYVCEARNFTEAKWNGKEFEGITLTFTGPAWEEELHWDDDPRYGTVKPYREMDDPLEDCPQCGKHTVRGKTLAEGGGIECMEPDCDYWFCY